MSLFLGLLLNLVFWLSAITSTKNPKIKVIAGKSTVKKSSFDLLTYKPFEEFDKEGLRVVVNAKRKSSLKENSPVYYRQLQIGVVEKYELSKNSTSIKLQLFIEKKYIHLVRKNSIFYNAGAFGVDLYLFGIKIKTETLKHQLLLRFEKIGYDNCSLF